MTREDLPPAVDAIRSALADWLALPQHDALRAWVLEERPVAPLPPVLAPAALRRIRSE